MAEQTRILAGIRADIQNGITGADKGTENGYLFMGLAERSEDRLKKARMAAQPASCASLYRCQAHRSIVVIKTNGPKDRPQPTFIGLAFQSYGVSFSR